MLFIFCNNILLAFKSLYDSLPCNFLSSFKRAINSKFSTCNRSTNAICSSAHAGKTMPRHTARSITFARSTMSIRRIYRALAGILAPGSLRCYMTLRTAKMLTRWAGIRYGAMYCIPCILAGLLHLDPPVAIRMRTSGHYFQPTSSVICKVPDRRYKKS